MRCSLDFLIVRLCKIGPLFAIPNFHTDRSPFKLDFLSDSLSMDLQNAEIEWEKYNFIQRFIFWCVLHYQITLPVLFGFVSIVMLVNCRIAATMLRDQEKVGSSSCELMRRKRKRRWSQPPE